MKLQSIGWRLLASVSIGLGLGVAGGAPPAAAYAPSGLLEIHVINVQQGASTLVVGPDGTTILMDAGDDGKGKGEVVPYLEEIGLLPANGLDYTIASHLHADHIGGLDEVLDAGYQVHEENWYNAEVDLPLPADAPRAIADYFRAAAATPAGGPTPIDLGRRLELGGGAVLTVIAAGGQVLGHGYVAGSERDENDLSVAVLIQYGEFDFIWAGDLGGGEDDRECTGRFTDQVNLETPLARAITHGGAHPLLNRKDVVEVMQVNHHGSRSSTNSDWMNLLRPRVAVVPVGSHKGYGHPHAVVVDNVLLGRAPCVTAPPALVLQTDEGHAEGAGTSFSGFVVGDVKITTDGGNSYKIEAGGDVRHGSSERRAAGLPAEMCMAGETALCLNDERFRVTVEWRTPTGDTGPGRAEKLTGDTGYFWFFNPDNVEMVIKVLDACVDPFDRFWVFAAGLTNVRAEITVTDTHTGGKRTYVNPQGTPFQPIQDTDAFECGSDKPPEPPPPGGVILSEVFYDADGLDDGLEWVELYNRGAVAVDLAGYSLGNGGDDYTYSKVQLSGTLAPGETFVVGGPLRGSSNGFPTFDLVAEFDPPFQNSGDPGDGVALFDRPTSQVSASTVPVDAVVYGPNNGSGLIDESGSASPPEVGDAPSGASIERVNLAGDWRIRPTPSPNSAPHL